jgi:hypothetical protein
MKLFDKFMQSFVLSDEDIYEMAYGRLSQVRGEGEIPWFGIEALTKFFAHFEEASSKDLNLISHTFLDNFFRLSINFADKPNSIALVCNRDIFCLYEIDQNGTKTTFYRFFIKISVDGSHKKVEECIFQIILDAAVKLTQEIREGKKAG